MKWLSVKYNYNKFLSDSSDDSPKYGFGIKQEDDDWIYQDAYKNPNDPYDHIEETERNNLLGQDEQLSEEDFLSSFQEVLRLARCAVQPWWTDEYKAKSETKIDLIQEYFSKLKNKS